MFTRRICGLGQGCFRIWSWLLLFPAAAAVAAESTPPVLSTEGHLHLVPAGNGRKLEPGSPEAPPAVLDFWEAHGREWSLYWDFTTKTPRFLAPEKPLSIAAPHPMGPAEDLTLTSAVEAFIDAHAALLGVSAANLGTPYVYTIAGDWVYVFPETTPGGLPVRGANLRVVVSEAGWLRWVKSFVIRDVKDPEVTLLTQDEARARVDPADGEILSAALEIGFSTNQASDALALWSFRVLRDDNIEWELLLNAATGAMESRARIVDHGGVEDERGETGKEGLPGGGGAGVHRYTGKVTGVYPGSSDFFASPLLAPNVESGIPHALIRDFDRDRNELAVADKEGNFEAFSPYMPAMLNASLELRSIEGNPTKSYMVLWPLELDAGGKLVHAKIPGHDDDEDVFTPDQTETHQEGTPTDHRFFIDPAAVEQQEVHTAWWIQCFAFASRQLKDADELLSKYLDRTGMDIKTFLPLPELKVQPTNSLDPTPNHVRRPGGTARIYVGIGTDNKRELPDGKVGVPTYLQREVGSHLARSMTGASELDRGPTKDELFTTAIEMAVGDAFTAFQNNDSRIGYLRLAQNLVSETENSWDIAGPRVRPEKVDGPLPLLAWQVEVQIAAALWKLHVATVADTRNKFRDREKTAETMILLWLGYNRVARRLERHFDNSYSLATELLLVDDSKVFDGDNDLSNGAPHSGAITRAFREVLLFDARFERGNANQDDRVDLSDAVYILEFLFLGKGPFNDCPNSLDANNSGSVELTDAVRLLQHLFLGGAPLEAPFLNCGLDPEPPGLPGNLGCRESRCN